MRDFRDAKIMAHALRDALKIKTIETTHSECLELIAKAFGYENWNILSAKIDAAQPHKHGQPTPSSSKVDSAPQTTLYCSFCGKSQHEVHKLIAGPTVFICDECVSLCDDIIDREDEQGILNLLKGDADSGNQAYQAALEHVRRMSTEEIKSFVIRCSRAAERNRVALQSAQRALAMRDGEVPQEGEAFAWVKETPREKLLTHLEEVERRLERYHTALRIGVTVLDERGRQN
jgi:uncharacterized protein YecT (DUF1311 family)